MLTATLQRRLHRELVSARHIPYLSHVDAHTLHTEAGHFVQTCQLGGASFESADDITLNQWHERLNTVWRNVASPNVALWMHLIRRRESFANDSIEADSFAARFAARYADRLSRQTLMVNELYVSLVYRPTAGAATSTVARLLSRRPESGAMEEITSSLEALDKLMQSLEAALARYEPERLSVHANRGRCCSAPLELFGMLVNGESQAICLPCAPIRDVLATSRLVFGTEVLEYRSPTSTRLGAMLGIKEYPTPTSVGMLNALLSAPFSFVLTQSFTFLGKAVAQGLLQRQFHRFSNSGDFAVSQAEELKVALDQLTSNEFVMGDHHLSLQVLTEWDSSVGQEGVVARVAQLNDHVALARSLLADTGMTVAREDLAMEAAFWAQLPGNFAMRPRKAPITSRNFAALACFHNFPVGRAHGNHWGDALALLITSAHSPYHFSLHASDPREADGGSRKDTGHTFLCGPTGSGKTVFIGFLVALLSRRETTQVVFDKDHGLEILVRALGGTYFALDEGEPSGLNPLQLETTAANVEFMRRWLRSLVRSSVRSLTAKEEAELDQALRGVLSLEPALRRLSRLIEYTDPTGVEGLHARLAPWCACTRGEYAWVFDNVQDTIAAGIQSATLVGFDVTRFLLNERTCAPLNQYLFHLVESLLDGRRLVCWVDEFSHALGNEEFRSFADNAPKTWRKLNGVLCVATQTAGSVLASDIARTIIEQTATKVFFPNPEASASEYVDGFSLTEREFLLIKEQLEPGSRKFLIKQGHNSVVCELDLKGFSEELAVISGRKEAVGRVRELIAVHGSSPESWLPTFLESARQ